MDLAIQKIVEGLKAQNFNIDSISSSGRITFSLTAIGLPGIYAVITAEEVKNYAGLN